MEAVASLVPTAGDHADGLDIPLGFLRLSEDEQKLADQLIELWGQASLKVRRWVQGKLKGAAS